MSNILLAEDDDAARTLLARALAADGHRITEAENGQEALDKLGAGAAIDLVISDVDMPVIDGIELARRAVQARPGLKVLLVTGHAQGLERARATGAAGIRTLSKPFTVDQLREEVRKMLG